MFLLIRMKRKFWRFNKTNWLKKGNTLSYGLNSWLVSLVRVNNAAWAGSCSGKQWKRTGSLRAAHCCLLGFCFVWKSCCLFPQLSTLLSAGENTHAFLIHEFSLNTILILFNSEFSLGIGRASVRDLSRGGWPGIEGSESRHVGSGNVTTSAIKLKPLVHQPYPGMP